MKNFETVSYGAFVLNIKEDWERGDCAKIDHRIAELPAGLNPQRVLEFFENSENSENSDTTKNKFFRWTLDISYTIDEYLDEFADETRFVIQLWGEGKLLLTEEINEWAEKALSNASQPGEFENSMKIGEVHSYEIMEPWGGTLEVTISWDIHEPVLVDGHRTKFFGYVSPIDFYEDYYIDGEGAISEEEMEELQEAFEGLEILSRERKFENR